MLVRQLRDIKGTDREVSPEIDPNWISHRLLIKDDGMGFSFHDTRIFADTETHIYYKNHLEAVYCVAGRGEIETLGDGNVYKIEDGTMYALDKHDDHLLRCEEEMRLICVFNPPLSGREVHDEDGVYPCEDREIHTYL